MTNLKLMRLIAICTCLGLLLVIYILAPSTPTPTATPNATITARVSIIETIFNKCDPNGSFPYPLSISEIMTHPFNGDIMFTTCNMHLMHSIPKKLFRYTPNQGWTEIALPQPPHSFWDELNLYGFKRDGDQVYLYIVTHRHFEVSREYTTYSYRSPDNGDSWQETSGIPEGYWLGMSTYTFGNDWIASRPSAEPKPTPTTPANLQVGYSASCILWVLSLLFIAVLFYNLIYIDGTKR